MKRGLEEMAGAAGGSISSDDAMSASTTSSASTKGAGKAPRSGYKGSSHPGNPSWLELVEDGRKRTRRPPPRFESAASAQEEMRIRQAIENSKIETTLNTDGLRSIPEVPSYRCVVVAF